MTKGAPDHILLTQVAITVDNVPIVPEEATESVIDTYKTYSGSSDEYQDLFNRRVPEKRKGILDEIELSCDDYDTAIFRIVVKEVVIVNGEKIPESWTKKYPGLQLKAGQQILVQVKSDGETPINAYCDVSYKEVG